MRTILLSLVLLGALTSCNKTYCPRAETKLKDLNIVRYMRVSYGCQQYKFDRTECGTWVETGGCGKYLVDDAGKRVELKDEMTILNYFSGKGWKYVEYFVTKDRVYYLFERG